jgi:actin related protein 2/3 complex subunit 2
MIHLEHGHRIVGETVAARINAERHEEAVDVRAADFDHVEYHVTINPDERTLMKVSVKVPAFDEVKAAVGDAYFSGLYGGMLAPAAEQGFSLTLNVDLAACATLDAAGKDALVRKLQCMARDVLGAPLWECLRCLEKEMPPPKPSYTIPYRGNENMYIVPSSDLCVVVYSFAFENAVEQAIAKVFCQEIEITRRQSRDLATAPSVAFTVDPPRELQGMSLPKAPANFIGYVSLAISKRNVEGGRLEKVVGLAQSYRAFLVLHIKATKSQMHTRIRGRSSTWLQVLNRAVPEKLNAEKKTITGRTFKR